MTSRSEVVAPAPVYLWSVRSGSAYRPIETSVGAEFFAQQISSRVIHLGVAGEIDIRNAPALGVFVEEQFRSCQRIVLDLTEVEFFGVAGLSVFDRLDRIAAQHDRLWALACGRPVHRLLRIADPHRETHLSLDAALASWNSVA